MKDADTLAKDETHPIPDVEVIDVHGDRKDGGHDLVIVVAAPLNSDERSIARLRKKLDGYLAAVRALKKTGQSGVYRVIVKIHGDSDGDVFRFLERSRTLVDEFEAELVIEEFA